MAVDGRNGVPGATYREQTVEIALGPEGSFGNGNVGALTRRVAANRVVTAAPARRAKPKPPKVPKTPRVIVHLRKAHEWQAFLESGEAANQADIARREGITRARVTQIIGMLRLAPEIQEHIIMERQAAGAGPSLTERALRPIAMIGDSETQRRAFQRLLNSSLRPQPPAATLGVVTTCMTQGHL